MVRGGISWNMYLYIYTIRAIAENSAGAGWLPALSKTYRNLSFLPVASWTPGKKTNIMSSFSRDNELVYVCLKHRAAVPNLAL